MWLFPSKVVCLVAARPYIYRHFNEKTFVTVDSRVSLICVAAGNPPPTVTWTLDDTPLTPTDDDVNDDDETSRYVIVSSVTSDGDVVSYVNVSNVRVSDGGTYRCSARNRVGVEGFSGKLHVYGTCGNNDLVVPFFKLSIIGVARGRAGCRGKKTTSTFGAASVFSASSVDLFRHHSTEDFSVLLLLAL